MRIGIIGDIHANLEALEAVLDFAREKGVSRYVCIGDIVGYNANPHECLDIVRGLELLAVVKGNHDEYVGNAEQVFNFNPSATKAIEWTRKQLSDEEIKWLRALPLKKNVGHEEPLVRFCAVHGTLCHPEKWGYILDSSSAIASMQFQWCPLCFVGHTHVPAVYEKNIDNLTILHGDKIQLVPGRQYLVNCGSIGQPRDRNNQASFVIYDVEQCTITRYRVPYDIEKAQQKILTAGLPERCASRLALGR